VIQKTLIPLFLSLSFSLARADGVDFKPELDTLFRVVACGGDGPLPDRFDASEVNKHCKALRHDEDDYRRRWLKRARPFFTTVVPAGLPDKVVYPFGGGDLITALVTFPSASEITTVSLEPAGDPRAIDRVMAGELVTTLASVRTKMKHLLQVAHSLTLDMRKLAKDHLPGELMYAVIALEMNGYQPVKLRLFRLGPDGAIVYITQAELDAAQTKEEQARLFANLEIEFRAKSSDGPTRVFRHIAANLDDAHLENHPEVLRHLEAKGRVTAMTKAASYLLWWSTFSRIRNYLLTNMQWMISDSTGIPTTFATAAGFEQVPYGRFDGPFLPNASRFARSFRELWAGQPYRPLSFRFGYPDNAKHSHLLITRRIDRK
jgi:hypothetical protein